MVGWGLCGWLAGRRDGGERLAAAARVLPRDAVAAQSDRARLGDGGADARAACRALLSDTTSEDTSPPLARCMLESGDRSEWRTRASVSGVPPAGAGMQQPARGRAAAVADVHTVGAGQQPPLSLSCTSTFLLPGRREGRCSQPPKAAACLAGWWPWPAWERGHVRAPGLSRRLSRRHCQQWSDQCVAFGALSGSDSSKPAKKARQGTMVQCSTAIVLINTARPQVSPCSAAASGWEGGGS